MTELFDVLGLDPSDSVVHAVAFALPIAVLCTLLVLLVIMAKRKSKMRRAAQAAEQHATRADHSDRTADRDVAPAPVSAEPAPRIQASIASSAPNDAQKPPVRSDSPVRSEPPLDWSRMGQPQQASQSDPTEQSSSVVGDLRRVAPSPASAQPQVQAAAPAQAPTPTPVSAPAPVAAPAISPVRAEPGRSTVVAAAAPTLTAPQAAPVAAPPTDAPKAPGTTVETVEAHIAAATAAEQKAALAPLFLQLAVAHRAAGNAAACLNALRSAAGYGALHGPVGAHAIARMELGEIALQSGDAIGACEQWQIARLAFHDDGQKDAYHRVDKRMRDNGCPTDWVLTDF